MSGVGCLSVNLSALREHLVACAVCADRQRLQKLAVEILLALQGSAGAGLKVANVLSPVGENSPPCSPTFDHFVRTRFESDFLAQLSTPVRNEYKYALRRHILPVIGGLTLAEVSFENIQREIVHAMLDAGFSVRTAKEARRVVAMVFMHAQRTGHYTGEPPTVGTRFPLAKPRMRRALTIPQVRAVLAALADPFRVMAILAVVTSMSLAELSALRWKRLNLSARPISCEGESLPAYSLAVRETYYRGVFSAPRTQHQRRYVVLPHAVVVALQNHQALAPFSELDDIVFATGKGTPFLPSFLHGRLQSVARTLGLGSLSWTTFRETYVTLADRFGVAASDKRVQMGVAAQWVVERYPGSNIDRQRPVCEAIAQYIA